MAIKQCRSHGGYLAVLSDREEFERIRNYLLSIGHIEQWHFAFIDGTDLETEGVFLTENGVQLTDIPFTGKEPNGNTFENCLGMNALSVADVYCLYHHQATWLRRAVCEMD